MGFPCGPISVNANRLYISQNRFTLPSGAVELSSAFLNLQELQLNRTPLTWTDFTECLLPHLPKLITVELGYNRLIRLSDEATRQKPPTTDTRLSTVNFDGNSLNNWPEICSSLAKYPTWVLLPFLAARQNLTRTVNPRVRQCEPFGFEPQRDREHPTIAKIRRRG